MAPPEVKVLMTLGVKLATNWFAAVAEMAFETSVAACCTAAGTTVLDPIPVKAELTAAAAVEEVTVAAVAETAAGAVGVTVGRVTFVNVVNVYVKGVKESTSFVLQLYIAATRQNP